MRPQLRQPLWLLFVLLWGFNATSMLLKISLCIMFDILCQLPLIPGSISQQDLIKLTRGPFCQAKVQIQTWMGKKSWTQIKRKAMIAKRSTQGAMIVKSWTRGAMITRRRLFCHFPEAPPVVVASALLRPNCPNCQSVGEAAAFSSSRAKNPPTLTMCCWLGST